MYLGIRLSQMANEGDESAFIKCNEAFLCFSETVLGGQEEAEHRGTRAQSSDTGKWMSSVASKFT